MLIPRKTLKYLEKQLETNKETIQVKSETASELDVYLLQCLLEAEELKTGTNEAVKASKQIQMLLNGRQSNETVELEKLKLQLQIIEAEKRQMVNWDILLPKLIGIGVAGLVTIFWLCLEQGTPLPMRLVKLVGDLTMPRGL